MHVRQQGSSTPTRHLYASVITMIHSSNAGAADTTDLDAQVGPIVDCQAVASAINFATVSAAAKVAGGQVPRITIPDSRGSRCYMRTTVAFRQRQRVPLDHHAQSDDPFTSHEHSRSEWIIYAVRVRAYPSLHTMGTRRLLVRDLGGTGCFQYKLPVL